MLHILRLAAELALCLLREIHTNTSHKVRWPVIVGRARGEVTNGS